MISLKDGFDKIVQIVNKECNDKINWLDALQSSPVLQCLHSNEKVSSGQNKSSGSDKEKTYKDQDGETLENFSSIGNITFLLIISFAFKFIQT